MEETLEYTLKNIQSVASHLIRELSDYKIWVFEGNMGAGKTTLIKQICALMEVQNHVSSPTFSIVNEYETKDDGMIYHFDFYRIKHETEALDIGVDEYFDSGNYCLIEWASQIPSLLPQKRVEITITTKEINKRTLTIQKIK
jgi:tRNA threonylcarbamoyladenosine biosynthesis protein TsaE